MTVDTLASSVLSLSRSCCFSLRFFIVSLRWPGLLDYAAAAIASTSAKSMVMPGPMVEVMVIFLTYLPLAAAGLAFTTASITAWGIGRGSCRGKGETSVVAVSFKKKKVYIGVA